VTKLAKPRVRAAPAPRRGAAPISAGHYRVARGPAARAGDGGAGGVAEGLGAAEARVALVDADDEAAWSGRERGGSSRGQQARELITLCR
jgi:hypothetical protein